MQNEAQYDLDRKAANISALSSNNLAKYEYLIGEDWVLNQAFLNKLNLAILHWVKVLLRGQIKLDQKEGLFKRLKNIENVQKNLIKGNYDESIYYTSRLPVDSKDDEDKDQKKPTKQQVGSKPLNVFDYLKSLSQKAKDLADEIKDADDGIDIDELLFIGSNREKFNFNIFRTPLSFLSTIYNGETTFKEVEIFQRDL